MSLGCNLSFKVAYFSSFQQIRRELSHAQLASVALAVAYILANLSLSNWIAY